MNTSVGTKNSNSMQSVLTSRPKAVRFYLVRHGETFDNAKGLVVGQDDSPLSPLGERQAQALGETDKIRSVAFWKRCASDLGRTQQTAERVLPNQPFLSDARLREVSKGARQGFPKSWTYEQALEARKANGQDIPLLETAQDTWERIFSWMYEVMVQSEKEETISNNADASEEEEEEDVRKVLVISHAGTLRLLLHHLVPDGHAALKMADDPSRPPDDDSQRFAVPNTSLTILEVALREDAPTQQQKTSGDDDDIHTPNNMEPPPVPPEEHQRLWTTRLVELTWTGHYESIIR